ncbi:MAG: hypothetical protein AAF610_03580 [Pseudomonadota bacterium]
MDDNAQLDTDVQALRVRVGDPAFERGRSLLTAGGLTRIEIADRTARAVTTGTPSYAVEIKRTARGFDGACECPESEGFDFCEHCIGLALHVLERDARRSQALAGTPDERLRLYLEDQRPADLIDLILNTVEQVPELRDRLQLRSDLAAGAIDRRALKKRVTAALPLREIWQSAKARAYFSRAVTGLSDLLEVADVIPPADLMAIAEYAIERLVRVLERIDDSNGHRWFAQDRIRDLYAMALMRSNLTADQRAAHLLKQVLSDPTDAFNAGADDFETALGDDGVAAFYRTVRRQRAETDDASTHRRLTSLLEARAQKRGDIDALIALKREESNTAVDFYQLCELYLSKPDFDAALAALEQGDDLAGPDRRNLGLRVDVHEARQEWDKAVRAQTDALLRAPTPDAYDRLAALADRIGTRQHAMRRAESELARQLSAGHTNRNAAATVLARAAWSRNQRDRAFNVAVEHINDPDFLMPMVDGLQDEQPAKAAQLFDCAVEATIAQKKNGAYRDAVRLIREYRELFDELGPGMFDAFLTDLRERHRAKRNLMTLLDRLVALDMAR